MILRIALMFSCLVLGAMNDNSNLENLLNSIEEKIVQSVASFKLDNSEKWQGFDKWDSVEDCLENQLHEEVKNTDINNHEKNDNCSGEYNDERAGCRLLEQIKMVLIRRRKGWSEFTKYVNDLKEESMEVFPPSYPSIQGCYIYNHLLCQIEEKIITNFINCLKNNEKNLPENYQKNLKNQILEIVRFHPSHPPRYDDISIEEKQQAIIEIFLKEGYIKPLEGQFCQNDSLSIEERNSMLKKYNELSTKLGIVSGSFFLFILLIHLKEQKIVSEFLHQKVI